MIIQKAGENDFFVPFSRLWLIPKMNSRIQQRKTGLVSVKKIVPQVDNLFCSLCLKKKNWEYVAHKKCLVPLMFVGGKNPEFWTANKKQPASFNVNFFQNTNLSLFFFSIFPTSLSIRPAKSNSNFDEISLRGTLFWSIQNRLSGASFLFPASACRCKSE